MSYLLIYLCIGIGIGAFMVIHGANDEINAHPKLSIVLSALVWPACFVYIVVSCVMGLSDAD